MGFTRGLPDSGPCRTGLRAQPDSNQASFSKPGCVSLLPKYMHVITDFDQSEPESNRTMGLGLGTRRCVVAAPAIGSESASEAVSWIVCSAVAANGVHGPCEWYDDSRLALRASWSSRWLVAPNRLHFKSTLCTNALVYSCTRAQRAAMGSLPIARTLISVLDTWRMFACVV